MLKINILPLGAYQTNTYIIREEDSKSCCVIDPGYEADTILDTLDRLGLSVEAILLTHGHHDHVGAVREIAAETGCKVYIHPNDLTLPPAFTAGKLYYTDHYGEGDTLSLAGMTVRVLHTPGHTRGSVCLLCGGAMFSGDTLIAGSCGRTDLPGGDWATIKGSLQRLNALEEDYRVFPGHGESTTLAMEKQYNPYLR